eukprot:3660877-Prymnesium_polylepis.1
MPPVLVLDEQFVDSSQFSVADNDGNAQPFFSDGYADYFGLLDGSNSTFTGDAGSSATGTDAAPRAPAYTGFSTPFLVAQDIDGEGGIDPFMLTWSAVDISDCMALSFSGMFAQQKSRSDGVNGEDDSDYTRVQAIIDGAEPQNVLWLSANTLDDQGKLAPDRDFDGFGEGDVLTLAAQKLHADINATGSSL